MTEDTRWHDPDDAAEHARLTAPGALPAAAAWYARNGIAVFPLTPGSKVPLPGSRGFKDATTDPEQIQRWWAATPAANIGLPTGQLFDVVDIDGPPGFLALVRAHTPDGAPLLEQLVDARVGNVRTPRGAHWYVPATGQGNRAGLLPGVDYRGLGGYVVAPPSIVGGRLYRWIDAPRLAVAG